jgi:hypothetical protein
MWRCAVVAHDIKKPITLTDKLFLPGTSIIKPHVLLQWLISTCP